MIVDPVEAFKATTSSIAPIPTVVPGNTPIYEHRSETGHRALWVVCVLMGISSLIFYAMALRVPVQKRLFHILTAFITTFAFVSYFAMATGDGISYKKSTEVQTHKHVPDTYQDTYREVYWARYVDWSLTTPLLLLDLSFLAGLNGASILVAVVADLIMVLVGLFAAFGHSSQKWVYYAIACAAYLVIIWQLGYNGRAMVQAKGKKTATFFYAIAGFTLILWTLYPIIWGFADGARTVGPDGEIIAYAILDILAKPVFGFWLLFTHDSVSETSTSLEGFWSHGLAKEGGIRVGDEEDGA